MDGKDQVDIF
jgi:hypothetical protein